MPQNKLKQQQRTAGGHEDPGMPGYRTRDGRTGFDPIDTYQETAHMEGTFYRNLFTLRLRTRDPFYLSLMFVFGVIPFIALVVAFLVMLWEAMQSLAPFEPGLLIVLALFAVIAGFLAANFVLSLREMRGSRRRSEERAIRPDREEKKRTPRRRKDYR